MTQGWGKIMIGVRLEKMVESSFFRTWSRLLTQGMRSGDMWEMTEGMTAYAGANTLVRNLLKSPCDTLLLLDSDAEVSGDFLEEFRNYEPGWDYDALQAWYPRRGWPPESIWFKEDGQGNLHNCVVLEKDQTEDVAFIGTHAVLIRRRVFEKMLGEEDPNKFDWFFYPRHQVMTEDAAFSYEARKVGARLGATSHVRANHISHLSVGWDSYQEYLQSSGQMDQVYALETLITLLHDFTHEDFDTVSAKIALGGKPVKEMWEKISPKTPDEKREFYGREDSQYLWDLAKWNHSLPYIRLMQELQMSPAKRPLVIGAGLGSEIEALRVRMGSPEVWYYELPGVLRSFCEQRFSKDAFVHQYIGKTLEEALTMTTDQFDLVVAVDTFEHMDANEMIKVLDLLDEHLSPGGALFAHNTWGQQDLYPMHENHSEEFSTWISQHSYQEMSDHIWQKP